MRKARLLVGGMLSIVAVGSLATALAGQAPLLEQLNWMAGCWERTAGDRWLEEQWMRPRGGMMLGMSRTVREDRVVGYEALRIEERGGRLVYVAHPSGQAVAEFGSAEVSETLVAFENREHDFPQRIIYRRGDGDSLFARIEGQQGDEVRSVEFKLARVRCPGVTAEGSAELGAERRVVLGWQRLKRRTTQLRAPQVNASASYRIRSPMP